MKRKTVTGTERSTTIIGTGEQLTTLEEKVLRMRYGLNEGPDHKLVFLGQDNPETRARLAMMEYEALKVLKKTKDPENKKKIINRLKDL